MAYGKNMQAAAHRHYADGCKLLADERFDNAGYHFGLAAECAIKQKLLTFGLPHDEAALWKHWPELKALALAAVSTRQAAPTRTLLMRGNFMQHWEIVMRYAPSGSVDKNRADRWRTDANEALGLLI